MVNFTKSAVGIFLFAALTEFLSVGAKEAADEIDMIALPSVGRSLRQRPSHFKSSEITNRHHLVGNARFKNNLQPFHKKQLIAGHIDRDHPKTRISQKSESREMASLGELCCTPKVEIDTEQPDKESCDTECSENTYCGFSHYMEVLGTGYCVMAAVDCNIPSVLQSLIPDLPSLNDVLTSRDMPATNGILDQSFEAEATCCEVTQTTSMGDCSEHCVQDLFQDQPYCLIATAIPSVGFGRFSTPAACSVTAADCDLLDVLHRIPDLVQEYGLPEGLSQQVQDAINGVLESTIGSFA